MFLQLALNRHSMQPVLTNCKSLVDNHSLWKESVLLLGDCQCRITTGNHNWVFHCGMMRSKGGLSNLGFCRTIDTRHHICPFLHESVGSHCLWIHSLIEIGETRYISNTWFLQDIWCSIWSVQPCKSQKKSCNTYLPWEVLIDIDLLVKMQQSQIFFVISVNWVDLVHLVILI